MATNGSGSVVLYGGYGPDWQADTWVWNGSTWTEQVTGDEPTIRQYPAMAASGTGEVILFGGWAFGWSLNDTWQWS